MLVRQYQDTMPKSINKTSKKSRVLVATAWVGWTAVQWGVAARQTVLFIELLLQQLPQTIQNFILVTQVEHSSTDIMNIQGTAMTEKEGETTLSKHIWDLKDENENYDTRWSLVDRASPFNPVSRKCRLCLKEIFYIIFEPETATLNKRSELYSTRRHRLKGLLVNVK